MASELGNQNVNLRVRLLVKLEGSFQLPLASGMFSSFMLKKALSSICESFSQMCDQVLHRLPLLVLAVLDVIYRRLGRRGTIVQYVLHLQFSVRFGFNLEPDLSETGKQDKTCYSGPAGLIYLIQDACELKEQLHGLFLVRVISSPNFDPLDASR
jgi:hypothetical protein